MSETVRISFLLGFIYLLCMFHNPAGITFPILMVCILAACLYLTKQKGGKRDKVDYFYCGSCILISISVVLTDSSFLHFCGKAGIALLLIVYVIKKSYPVENMGLLRGVFGIFEFLTVSLFNLVSPFTDYMSGRKRKGEHGRENGEEPEEESVQTQIVKGFFIAVPLIVVVGLLLVSADVVFRNILLGMFDSSADVDVIVRMFFTFLAGFLVAYCAIRTISQGRLKLLKGEPEKGSPVVAITFTTALSVVYVFFCAVQIFMMLYRSNGLLPAEYTYSRYAREGFFQLLFVALINFAVVFICEVKFRRNKILNGILTIITICTYMMIVSSATRMVLYVKEYHFTFLRLFVLWFLGLLAILTGGLLVSVFRENFHLFEYCVAVVTVCYLILAFARPDALVAKYNIFYVDRQGEQMEYMTTLLSDDAAEYLAEADRTGRDLTGYFEKIYENYDSSDVRTWNYSKYQAYQAAKKYLGK